MLNVRDSKACVRSVALALLIEFLRGEYRLRAELKLEVHDADSNRFRFWFFSEIERRI